MRIIFNMKISRSIVIYSKISNLLLSYASSLKPCFSSLQLSIKWICNAIWITMLLSPPLLISTQHLPLTRFRFSCIYRGQSVHWKKYKVQSSKLLTYQYQTGKAGLQCRGMYTTLKTFMNVITRFVIRCMHDFCQSGCGLTVVWKLFQVVLILLSLLYCRKVRLELSRKKFSNY